jgi:hypothetical protein
MTRTKGGPRRERALGVAMVDGVPVVDADVV